MRLLDVDTGLEFVATHIFSLILHDVSLEAAGSLIQKLPDKFIRPQPVDLKDIDKLSNLLIATFYKLNWVNTVDTTQLDSLAVVKKGMFLYFI